MTNDEELRALEAKFADRYVGLPPELRCATGGLRGRLLWEAKVYHHVDPNDDFLDAGTTCREVVLMELSSQAGFGQ